jgi:hypothetical protein
VDERIRLLEVEKMWGFFSSLAWPVFFTGLAIVVFFKFRKDLMDILDLIKKRINEGPR